MGHMVMGYPDLNTSFETALSYIESGVRYLEIQIPFSHPTADGPVITQANRLGVGAFRYADDVLDFIKNLVQIKRETQIVPMTYTNKLLGLGGIKFAEKLQALGIESIIVPDLPIDSPEADELQASGLKLVPVLAPNTPMDRVKQLLGKQSPLVYIMSNFSITGQAFSVHDSMRQFIAQIKTFSTAQLGVGFGIKTAKDVEEILDYADFAIVGTALIEAQKEGKLPEVLEDLING